MREDKENGKEELRNWISPSVMEHKNNSKLPQESAKKAPPAERKLTTTEVFIGWLGLLSSIVFYGISVYLNRQYQYIELAAKFIFLVKFITFGVVSPLAVVFYYITEKYCEKKHLAQTKKYVLSAPKKSQIFNQSIEIIGGVIIGGAAWSLTGLIYYIFLIYWI